MTTLSDLNIVVQQSGGAKTAQKLLHALQEQSHLAAGQQRTREGEQRTTIQGSEDSKRAQLEKESPDKRSEKRKKQPKAERRGPRAAEPSAAKPQGEGNFVDTVA